MLIETESHRRLRDAIRAELGPWRRFLIAIDGVDGAGKSTLARYLAWQLEMPAVHTDLFLEEDASDLVYRFEEMCRVVSARLDRDRPVLIEGIRVLQVLKQLRLTHDYLIWVEQQGYEGSYRLQDTIRSYEEEFAPRSCANQVFTFEMPFDEDRVGNGS